jgi:hypothetical protein
VLRRSAFSCQELPVDLAISLHIPRHAEFCGGELGAPSPETGAQSIVNHQSRQLIRQITSIVRCEQQAALTILY